MEKEAKIDKFYGKHTPAIIKIFNAFYRANKDDFENKLKEYKDGEITKNEYRQYMMSKTILSNEWRKTVDKLTDTITTINQSALYSVVNKGLEDIYIGNYNATIKAIGGDAVEN